jgi:hypothetical protein
MPAARAPRVGRMPRSGLAQGIEIGYRAGSGAATRLGIYPRFCLSARKADKSSPAPDGYNIPGLVSMPDPPRRRSPLTPAPWEPAKAWPLADYIVLDAVRRGSGSTAVRPCRHRTDNMLACRQQSPARCAVYPTAAARGLRGSNSSGARHRRYRLARHPFLGQRLKRAGLREIALGSG